MPNRRKVQAILNRGQGVGVQGILNRANNRVRRTRPRTTRQPEITFTPLPIEDKEFDPASMSLLPTNSTIQRDKESGYSVSRIADSFFHDKEHKSLPKLKFTLNPIEGTKQSYNFFKSFVTEAIPAGFEAINRLIETSSVAIGGTITAPLVAKIRQSEGGDETVGDIININNELMKEIMFGERQAVSEAAQIYLKAKKIGIYGGEKVTATDILVLTQLGFSDLAGHPVFITPFLKKFFVRNPSDEVADAVKGSKAFKNKQTKLNAELKGVDPKLASKIRSLNSQRQQLFDGISTRAVRPKVSSQQLATNLSEGTKIVIKIPKVKKGMKITYKRSNGTTAKGIVRTVKGKRALVETASGAEPVALARLKPFEGNAIPLTPTEFEGVLKHTAPKARVTPVAGVEQLKTPKQIVSETTIIKNLEEALGVPVRQGKFNQRALAIFKPTEHVIRLKQGAVPVVSHEAGHFIQAKIPVLKGNKLTPFRKELEPIASKPAGRPTIAKVLDEGGAEFTRLFVADPKAAQKQAPRFYAFFEDTLRKENPEFLEALYAARADYARFLKQPSTSKILSKINTSPQTDKSGIRNFFTRLYTQWVDDLNPLKHYRDLAVSKGIKLRPEEDPYILSRLMRGWQAKANVFLTHGTFSRKFWKVREGSIVPDFKGKGLQQILRPVDEQGLINELRAYLVSKRAVELGQRKISAGVTIGDAKMSIKELEKAYPFLKKVSKDLFKFQDDVLQYGYENGLYDKALMTKMRNLNKNYTPLYRVMEEAYASGGLGKSVARTPNTVRKIKGSERDIIDPLESIMKNTYAIVNAADRNAAAVAVSRLSKLDPALGRLVEEIPLPQTVVAQVSAKELLKSAYKRTTVKNPSKLNDTFYADEVIELIEDKVVNIFRPAFIADGNTMVVLSKGKPHAFQVEAELFKALQGGEASQWTALNSMLQTVGAPARLLRAGATLAPEFTLRNPARDSYSAYLFSEHGVKPAVDIVKGVFSMVRKADDYILWQMSGGAHSAMVSLDRRYIQKGVAELIASRSSKLKNVAKTPLESLRILSELGESANRIGEFQRGLKATKNPLLSGFASREVTLDFARKGLYGRALNQIIAFFNARIQGIDKLARSLVKHPVRTTARGVASITLPSIYLYLANRDDPRYQELPRWEKDLFWHILTEKHIWRIPKPFEAGVIFGTMPERILEAMDEKDPEAITQLFTDVAESPLIEGITPDYIPTALTPLIENMTNHDFFKNRSVVPDSIKDLEKEEQFTPYTTEIAKLIGDLTNQSPIQIDHLISGYTATLGRHATNMIDTVLLNMGIVPNVPQPTPTLADMPVIRAFISRDPLLSGQADTIDKFYKLYGQSQTERQTFNNFINKGEVKEAEEYAKTHHALYIATGANSVARSLSQLRKQANFIKNHKTMSGDDKQEALQNINYQMWFVAAQFLEVIEQSELQI